MSSVRVGCSFVVLINIGVAVVVVAMPVVAKVKEGIKDSVKCFMTAPSMVVNDNDDDKGLTKATMTATTTPQCATTMRRRHIHEKKGAHAVHNHTKTIQNGLKTGMLGVLDVFFTF